MSQDTRDELQRQKREQQSERYRLIRVKDMRIRYVTQKAYKVWESEDACGDDPRDIWLPISQVTVVGVVGAVRAGDVVDFDIPKWLVDEKELFYE